MVARCASVLALVACGHAPPAPQVAPQPVPGVDLVAFTDDGAVAKFFRVADDGTVATLGTAQVPGHAMDVTFVGRRVAVRTSDDDQVMFVAPTGTTRIAVPETVAWPAPTDTARGWELVATASGELWLGKCRAGTEGDFGQFECTKLDYARIVPPPVGGFEISDRKPARRPPPYALEQVVPPAWIRVSLEAGDAPLVRCVDNGATTMLPLEANRTEDGLEGRFAGMSDLVWLSANPPIFRARRNIARCAGMDATCVRDLTFERCAILDGFATASVIAGPDGMFALVSDEKLSVRRRGREVAAISGTFDHVGFLPR